MSLAQRAHAAYAQAATPIRSFRSIEYDAVSKISYRLRSSALDRDRNFPAFVAAVSANRKLWTTLAADVAQDGNQLSPDLRARLLWLARFTEEESRKILRGSGDVGILIEINGAIMQGLHPREDVG